MDRTTSVLLSITMTCRGAEAGLAVLERVEVHEAGRRQIDLGRIGVEEPPGMMARRLSFSQPRTPPQCFSMSSRRGCSSPPRR